MKTLHHLVRYLLLALTITLSSCASLPEVNADSERTEARAVPTVATAKGRLAKRQAADLLARRWAKASPDLKALATLEEAATGVPLIAGNNVKLLFDGPATMREMMAAASAARHTINLETYIFDQDEVGLQFAALLMEKRKQGVIVNLLYDSVGALGTPPEFFKRMKEAGINVLAFNPVNPTKRIGKWELNNRDHRKLMVVDGKVAFTGGINISSTYANSSFFRSKRAPTMDSRKVGWRDTHVKIEGPAVASLQYHFIDNWVGQDAGELAEANYFPTLAPAGNKLVRVLATDPARDSEIYKAFIVAIQEAKTSVHITSAYFVPDRQFIESLIAAAKRGVDVKLVLPGVSDHGLVMHAGRSFYDELLSNGVKIYQLQVAVLHAKTAVIDGTWSTVGSANIDRRSFLHNYELNIVVLDPAFGKDMQSAFAEDLRDSKEVTLEQWRRRPWADRIKEFAARLTEYWI
ncbi:cardiolipin synthase [Massilia sp. PAMC28688]|uniref:cardiolipin synthase n=1 Tax=Massilia sp. PAMC28688 TaxID=2861283 RepID=UPI001C6390FE|nr:cardiolipin synthase [Massilia sp. PAMC28688]QYF93839.1 cardiolipin synthase [Massilia sp. PAMC28688]